MAERFDIGGELPWGRTSIRASAGTGKTWTLAALATRYIAEADVPMGALLVVTFTRAAAAELRQRIRQRLTGAIDFCQMEGAAAAALAETDPLLAHFHSGAAGDLSVVLPRLRHAVADFDAATIGTIHGFAQQVLSSLGSASHGPSSAELDENTWGLVEEVTADVLVGSATKESLPRFAEVRDASMFVLNNPDVAIQPDPTDQANRNDGSIPLGAIRVAEVVSAVVDEVERRQRRANTMGYSGLLTGLRSALNDDADRSMTRALHHQFQVALVDEFQDTDPVQWEIFAQLFPEGDSTGDRPRALVMVGDPKQAIYSFRGANIHTYVDATQRATPSTLGENFRSDGRLITALESFFDGAEFGSGSIAFEAVAAAAPPSRLTVDDLTPPGLVVRSLSADNRHAVVTSRGRVAHSAASDVIAADLADRVVELLEDGRISPDPDDDASRRVRPQDIAVLITAYSQVPALRAALHRRGIPSVVARTGNVFESEAAEHWKWLLHGLARPADPMRARMVALSWFLPETATELADFSERDLSALQAMLAGWSDTLETQGVVALRHQVWLDGAVLERLLTTADGERIITDLEHIAEVLAAEVGDRPIGPVGLLTLFNELVLENPDEGGRNDGVSRRLESDDNAVQIMTIHVSKGLEFPIVMCPSMWPGRNHARITTNYQDGDRRVHDVANRHDWPTGKEAAARVDRSKGEDLGEQMRLVYVAMTRAAHQTVIWWTPGSTAKGSALTRLLFARDGGRVDPIASRSPKVPASPTELAEIREALAPLVEASGGTIAVQEVDGHVLDRVTTPTVDFAEAPKLGVAEFSRTFNRSRRRWSFTAMTAGLYEQRHEAPTDDDSVGERGAADEPPVDTEELAHVAREATDASLPLALVGAGAAFGTLVHEVLEQVDFAAEDLERELADVVGSQRGQGAGLIDTGQLSRGLATALQTPLGELFDGRPLSSFGRRDRRDEMNFDLPIGSGTDPHADPVCTVADIGQLLVEADACPAGPLREWAEALAEGAVRARLSGFLTGSIDGLFRVGDRFVVVDYKTNLLGQPWKPLHIDDYHPDQVREAMVHHHYPLQGLLYSVGLHRYLRSRLADYDPARHLGGMAYLFVRGMIGEETPIVEGQPHGVFSWRPAPEVIAGLSDLLHEGRRPGSAA